MRFLKSLYASAVIALGLTVAAVSPSQAGSQMTVDEARALVAPFYALLSGAATEAEVRASLATDWKSYYSIDGYKGVDETIGFLGALTNKMVPDLSWRMAEVLVTRDGRIVVIGEATGTPTGDTFFGAPMTGKSFKIMSIDVHTVRDGKVVESRHVEDWAGAMRQLTAE